MNGNTQFAVGEPADSQLNVNKGTQFSLEVAHYAETTVVHCRGRIVYRGQAGILSEKIADLLEHTRHLVMELSGIEMIDSAGLGELVVLLMWVQASGCSMKLAAPRRNLRELLELTNLASVFEIYPSLEAALRNGPRDVRPAGAERANIISSPEASRSAR